MEAVIKLYSLGYKQAKTYLAAALFTLGNMIVPQLCHTVHMGGPTWLPIYLFTLIGAYKYGDSLTIAQFRTFRNACIVFITGYSS